MKIYNSILLLLIIGNLSAQNKYNPRERPDWAGIATKVTVSIYVIDIEQIDNVKQKFTADIFITLIWKDPRLAGSARELALKDVWHPQAIMYNERAVTKRLPERVKIEEDGTVYYDQRIYGSFASRLNLSDFPFDMQKLPFTIVSYIYTPNEVEFIISKEFTGRDENFSIAEWTIGEGTSKSGAFHLSPSHQAEVKILYARYDYWFEARRQLSYYFWKVIVPLTIIVGMSWAVFWIDPSQTGPQIGVSATTILTLIAFLFNLGNILPRISYLTHIDLFIYSALSLVFIAFIEAVMTSILAARGDQERAKRFDKWARPLFPSAYFILLVWFWAV